MESLQLHPHVRLLLLITGVTGTILARQPIEILFFEALLLPMIIIGKFLRIMIGFIGFVILPMGVMFVVFHYLTGQSGNDIFPEVTKVLKLIVYTTLLQLAFIIPLNYVHNTFKQWGIKGHTLLTLTGSYFVWTDIINRSERIILARFSNGYVANRNAYTKLKQIPYIFIPLMIGIIRTATERSQSWYQKDLVDRIDIIEFPGIPIHKVYNSVVALISLSWLVFNIYSLIK